MAVRSSVYSDVDMSLSKQTDGDIQRDNDIDAIINSLNNIVATIQGSRRMIPEFAQDIWALLFEPLDTETARMIGERLLEAIQVWEDRVEVTRIDINPDYDNNLFSLRMNFKIKTVEEEETIEFVLFSQ